MDHTDPAQTQAPRILLVEDSETSAALLARILRGHYEVQHARNGEEAWNTLLKDPQVELVITDIQMPRMSGQELLTKIRASDLSEIRNLPVIVLTTADDSRDRDLAFKNGANDFVTKPVDPVELQARVAVHQKLARSMRELETSRKLYQEQAITDPLTKLRNRRAFFDIGVGHFALARRHGTELSVIALDIDHFKKINDAHGHQSGDEVLAGVAATLAATTRLEDVAARLGGEEFAVLLPDTNMVGAAVLAERIRVAIEEKKFAVGGKQLTITVSAGVACFGPDGKESLEQLLNVADQRLYKAKESGRNRVVVDNDGRSM